jgi:Extracellular link domain
MEQSKLDIQQTFQESLNSIFTKTNITFFITFLAIYLMLSYLLQGKTSDTSSILTFSRSIDMVLLLAFVFWVVMTYFQLNTKDKQNFISWAIEWTRTIFEDPTTVFTTLILIVLFYVTIYVCRVPMTETTKPVSIDIIESKLWILLLMAIFFDFFKYMLGVDLAGLIFSNLLNLWDHIPLANTTTPVVDSSNNSVSVPQTPTNNAPSTTDPSNNKIPDPSNNPIVIPPQPKPEVFNVSNNLYTYDDAQAVCKAFNSRLATYDEVEDSYNDGGEWCNYGWSENQMALFPTQKSTWDTLQKTSNHKNDCGRPGINGGYMANPNIKFGVNCFGIKPNPKESDIAKMSTNKDQVFPKSSADAALDSKVQYWKDNADKLLVLNPFNKTKWAEY